MICLWQAKNSEMNRQIRESVRLIELFDLLLALYHQVIIV